MFKLIVLFAVALGLLAIVDARREQPNHGPGGPSQIFGRRSHGSFMLAEFDMNVYNSNPNGRVRRFWNFPAVATDESRTPRIGAVYIWNSGTTSSTRTTLRFGGPGKRFVGLELVSGVGEHLRSRIEVFAL